MSDRYPVTGRSRAVRIRSKLSGAPPRHSLRSRLGAAASLLVLALCYLGMAGAIVALGLVISQ